MMACGHAANGQKREGDDWLPACVICSCAIPASKEPDLSGRTSRCSYFRDGYTCPDTGCAKAPHCPPTRHEQHGGNYPSVAPSSPSLPFFSHKPAAAHDGHFCGCWGWG